MPTKPGHITSERARELSAMRKTRSGGGAGGGRPKLLRPCPKCGAMFGARDLRAHIPSCARRELG